MGVFFCGILIGWIALCVFAGTRTERAVLLFVIFLTPFLWPGLYWIVWFAHAYLPIDIPLQLRKWVLPGLAFSWPIVCAACMFGVIRLAKKRQEADAQPDVPSREVARAIRSDFALIGATGIMLRLDGRVLYVDPCGLDPASSTLPLADLILITSERPEHFDAASLLALLHPGTAIFGPPRVHALFPRTTTPQPGANQQNGDLTIQTFAGDGGFGYLVSDRQRFYFSGPTAVRVPEALDVAFVCLGRVGAMSPEEAAAAVRESQPVEVWACCEEAAEEEAFAAALAGSGINVRRRGKF